MKVETKNLEMSLGGASILKGIDIALKNQEFVGVLGPNGSGKSTLLKCLYRVLKPTGGTVFLDGQELHQYKPKESAKKVAVVAQHNHSFCRLFCWRSSHDGEKSPQKSHGTGQQRGLSDCERSAADGSNGRL